MRRFIHLILIAASVYCGGCTSTKVVFIPEGNPVMLAEDVRAYVYYEKDGRLVKSQNRVRIPAGWWCLPDED